MIKLTALLILLATTLALTSPAKSSRNFSPEYWECDEEHRTQKWGLIKKIMFAPKGKGSMPLVYNTPHLSIAYHEGANTPSTWIYIIDKVENKMIKWNNLKATTLRSIVPDSHAESKVEVISCRRTNDS